MWRHLDAVAKAVMGTLSLYLDFIEPRLSLDLDGALSSLPPQPLAIVVFNETLHAIWTRRLGALGVGKKGLTPPRRERPRKGRLYLPRQFATAS